MANNPERFETAAELDSLPVQLGFIETEELKHTKQRLLDAFANGDPNEQVPYLSDLYWAAGRESLEHIDGTDSERYAKGQIGFIIARANIYCRAGQMGLYRTELEDAHTYAHNMYLDDVVTAIQNALDHIPTSEEKPAEGEVSSAELAEALKDDLPPEICEAIASMDLADALGYAFTELLSFGIDDPETYLREKGILE